MTEKAPKLKRTARRRGRKFVEDSGVDCSPFSIEAEETYTHLDVPGEPETPNGGK